MRLFFPTLFSVVACGCGPGFFKLSAACDGDVSCIDGMRGLPACEPLPSSDRLMLEPATLDGVQLKNTYKAAITQWGEPDACTLKEEDLRYWLCAWDGGAITGTFYGRGEDPERPDGTMKIAEVSVREPWGGSSADGLGVGISVQCWLDVLGAPTTVHMDYGVVEEMWIDSRHSSSRFFLGTSSTPDDSNGYVEMFKFYDL